MIIAKVVYTLLNLSLKVDIKSPISKKNFVLVILDLKRMKFQGFTNNYNFSHEMVQDYIDLMSHM